jgi:predicted nuclease of predicted toxin-antitoxin system
MNYPPITDATAKKLKKRSVANSASPKQLDELTFFLDRQLGRHKMAGILRAAGLKVVIHDDCFSQNAKDPEWLTAAGTNQWIVITRDEHIRYRAAEKQAIRRAKVRAFVLVARGDLRAEVLAQIFLEALPSVRAITAKQRAPFIAKIWRDGKVALLQS